MSLQILSIVLSVYCVLQLFILFKIHAVITSEDQICQVIPKMNGDETISLDSVEKGRDFKVFCTCKM